MYAAPHRTMMLKKSSLMPTSSTKEDPISTTTESCFTDHRPSSRMLVKNSTRDLTATETNALPAKNQNNARSNDKHPKPTVQATPSNDYTVYLEFHMYN
uniref:Uncharacterized protein n=1 Tax=Echinococcus granulosus TaxID=6210 RepID=A0A068WNU3_ECHGR|nr:hypothetical protein EgrG_000127500 [Echinococcus granulosus]